MPPAMAATAKPTTKTTATKPRQKPLPRQQPLKNHGDQSQTCKNQPKNRLIQLVNSVKDTTRKRQRRQPPQIQVQ